MFVKLPIADQTLPNSSGFSQATVHAQMPPDDRPPIARLAGSLRSLVPCFSTAGRISWRMKRAYWSESVSYSNDRLLAELPCRGRDGSLPGLTKTPTVTGISPAWIRLSKTTGTLQGGFM